MNKKGVSAVITSVLIILIVLAAVVLIWAMVNKVLSDSGERIQSGLADARFSIVSGSVCFNSSISSFLALQIKRNGGGDVVGYYVTIEDTNGESFVKFYNESVRELETKSVFFDYPDKEEISVIRVVPAIKTKSGKVTISTNEYAYQARGIIEDCEEENTKFAYVFKSGHGFTSYHYECISNSCAQVSGNGENSGGCTSENVGATCGIAPSPDCVDTDFGLNYTLKGNATGSTAGFGTILTDSCMSEVMLKEQYCLNESEKALYPGFTIGTKTFYCSSQGDQCVDGACAPISTVHQTFFFKSGVFNTTTFTINISTSYNIQDLFPGAPVESSILIYNNSRQVYDSSTMQASGVWDKIYLIDPSVGALFLILDYSGDYAVEITGTALDKKQPIRIKGEKSFVAVPYCENNYQYNASRLINEINMFNQDCLTIVSFNKEGGFIPFWSLNSSYSLDGAVKSDFKIDNYRTYEVECATDTDGSVLIPNCL